MLWSVIPEDIVLAGADEKISVIDGQVGECPCRLRVGADGALSVERVMSTDIRDYLRQELQPGQRVYVSQNFL